MSGQLWSVPAEGGFLYSDELSRILRMQLMPLVKFRQLCDAQDGTEKGLSRGDLFSWNVYSKVGRQGRRLSETEPMPETGFTVSQKSMTVTEWGQGVPYTGKLEALGKQDVVEIIDKALHLDARNAFDIGAWEEFDKCQLRVTPTSGTSTTAVDLATNGVAPGTNDVEFGTGHAKAIVDLMKERNIPPFMADDYVGISHPSTYRTFKNSLETLHQYTETGLAKIFNAEIGRYEGTRYIEQNHIPKGGAADSTSFDPYTETGDPWNNGKSGWIFFMGGDTVTEAVVIPEEIRAKLPGDFGRSKAIAWYYLGNFGIVHDQALNSRIVKWDSAA